MLSLNMMTLTSALKLISFFIVVNEMNDCLHIIRKSKVTEENKRKYFPIEQISDEVLIRYYQRTWKYF